jgi:protein-disulfide isomerase
MIERKWIMFFYSMLKNLYFKGFKFRVYFFAMALLAIVTGFMPNPLTSNALAQSQKEAVPQMDMPHSELDEAALKESIASRIRATRGTQDEKLTQINPDMVTIDRKVPFFIQGMSFFAVKVKILSPPPGAGEEAITLVVDKSGTLQIIDIQELASGNSPVQDALNQLIRAEDIPPDFGKEIFKGTGQYSIIVISDPFCPYCRKGWEYLKAKQGKLKSFRLSHFPLNRAAEVAAMVMADAHHRQFKLFEIVDFAYTRLNPDTNPQDILVQFMDAFPELKEIWGHDPVTAFEHLEAKYVDVVREEMATAQAVGINSTPVFILNGEFIQGFNAEKLDKIMQ